MRGRNIALRPVEPEDLVFLRELANDRVIASSVGGWALPRSDFGQSKWWDQAVEDPSTLRLVIVDADGTSVGLTGLWDIDWHSRHALTGVKLHQERVTKKGTATDAIKTLMAYAFYDVGLNRLWSEVLAFNGASMGAYVKNSGWKIEGKLREHALRAGRHRDVYIIAALKEDFDGLVDASEYLSRIVPIDADATIDIRPDWWASTIHPG